MKNGKSNGEVKEKGLWSIGESGVHLGNGQRIISGRGQKQFHYPLHPDLPLVDVCICLCAGIYTWVKWILQKKKISTLICVFAPACVCVGVMHTQVASQLHYLAHQLFFFSISAMLSELEQKDKRLIRQPVWEADTTLKRALPWCLLSVQKIITIIHLNCMSNLITLLPLLCL